MRPSAIKKHLALLLGFMSLLSSPCGAAMDKEVPEAGIRLEIGYLYGNQSEMLSHVRNGKSLPTNVEITHSYSIVHLEILKPSVGFYSKKPGKWSLHWSDGGDYEGKNPALWKGKDISDYVSLQENAQANSRVLSVAFPETIDIPEGNYTYLFYADADDEVPVKTLRRPNVDMTDNVNNTTGYMAPFVVFNVDKEGMVTSIEYSWMRHDGTGFVPAVPGDLEAMSALHGGASLHFGTASQRVSYAIKPEEIDLSATGTIDASALGAAPLRRADIDYLIIDFTSGTGVDVHFFMDPRRNVRTRAIQSYP